MQGAQGTFVTEGCAGEPNRFSMYPAECYKADDTFWSDIDTLVKNMKERQEYNFKELREKAKLPQLIYQELSSYLPVMQDLVDRL